ncbi:MAG: hypothetical protein MJ160_06485 [Treponema sp.]|nr:hypothetical protein [Treponema sp.]
MELGKEARGRQKHSKPCQPNPRNDISMEYKKIKGIITKKYYVKKAVARFRAKEKSAQAQRGSLFFGSWFLKLLFL